MYRLFSIIDFGVFRSIFSPILITFHNIPDQFHFHFYSHSYFDSYFHFHSYFYDLSAPKRVSSIFRLLYHTHSPNLLICFPLSLQDISCIHARDITSTPFKLALMETISRIIAVTHMLNFTLDNIKVENSHLSELSQMTSTVTYEIFLHCMTSTKDVINSLNTALSDGTYHTKLREICSFKNITASGLFSIMEDSSTDGDGDGTIAISKYKLGAVIIIIICFY